MSLLRRTSLAILLGASAALSQSISPAAARDLARLKSLAGKWTDEAAGLKVTYEVTSGGAVVIETRQPSAEPPMITVFHLDRGRLVLAHYCSAGNHPRMRARVTTSPDQPLEFATFDVANLGRPTDGHMQGMSIRFASPDEMVQTWVGAKRTRICPECFA